MAFILHKFTYIKNLETGATTEDEFHDKSVEVMAHDGKGTFLITSPHSYANSAMRNSTGKQELLTKYRVTCEELSLRLQDVLLEYRSFDSKLYTYRISIV